MLDSHLLQRVENGQNLSMEEMSRVIDQIMQGQAEEDEIARLLLGLRAKGETVEEIAGAAQSMRRVMTPIHSDKPELIDTCGTGGDGSRTFNISTAAALVIAAAGMPVAKHGNRKITSSCGSADVLVELGVNVEASVAQVEACLDQVGICFCFAPLMHQAMRHVGPVRKKLGVPTIFNCLGPLCNPAGAHYQLLGVGKGELRPLLAEALRLLGIKRACVVHGADGLDEVTLGDSTWVSEVRESGVTELTWTPVDFGLSPAGRETMLIETAQQSADIIRGILAGQPGPPRDIVTLNAAAALWTAGRADDLPSATRLAAEAIDSGAAKDMLRQLGEISHKA